MKRTVLFFSLCLLFVVAAVAQESLRTPVTAHAEAASGQSGQDAGSAGSDAALPTARDPELESVEWAAEQFAAFVQDPDMCDVGTALYEDSLRQTAMREHPDWPLWAIDLSLDEARDSYLRAMLFSR